MAEITICSDFGAPKNKFPGGPDSKASAYNAGYPGSIPGSGRSPGEGNGNPLQYSCLPPPKKRGFKEIFIRSNPTSKEQWMHRRRRAKRSYSTIKVRRGGGEEIP